MGHTAANAALPFINDTDANFRAWVQFISDNLQTAGFIKTADTGQVDTATVTRPLAVSTYQGYEIRRMDDALQASVPVFIKIEYGSLNNAATNPAIRLTIGTGSNGSGTITGSIFSATVFCGGNNTSAASVTAKFSGDDDRFVIALNYTTSVANPGVFILALERSKGPDFLNNSTGVYLVTAGGSSGYAAAAGGAFILIPFTGSSPTKEADGGAIHPGTDSTLDGSNVGIYPLHPTCFGKKVYPPTNFMVYRTNEISSDSDVTVDVDGTSIVYRTCGQRYLMSARTANNPACMFRYD